MNKNEPFLFIQEEESSHCGLNPEKHDDLLLIQLVLSSQNVWRAHLKIKLSPLPDESPPTHSETNQHKMDNELLEASLLQRLSFSCCVLPVQQGAVSAWQSPADTQRQADVWGTPCTWSCFHYSSLGAATVLNTTCGFKLKRHNTLCLLRWNGNHIPGH